jgi:hypothetical protein
MASHNHDIITSSENPNWRTERWLVQALDREFGIILDAAADLTNRVIADGRFLGAGSDLLENALCGVPWWDVVRSVYVGHEGGAGPVTGGAPWWARAIFCNPPYSRKQNLPIEPWVKQMATEGLEGTVIGVLPYSPQTAWWRTYVQGQQGEEDGQPYSHLKATEVRKFPFRLKFDPPADYTGKASGANVNTAIVIWRAQNGFVEPWIPYERYWVPAEFYDHARRDRRPKALRADR